MRNRTYGGVRGRKVSLPCGKLTFLLLDYSFAYRSLSREYHSRVSFAFAYRSLSREYHSRKPVHFAAELADKSHFYYVKGVF